MEADLRLPGGVSGRLPRPGIRTKHIQRNVASGGHRRRLRHFRSGRCAHKGSDDPLSGHFSAAVSAGEPPGYGGKSRAIVRAAEVLTGADAGLGEHARERAWCEISNLAQGNAQAVDNLGSKKR